MDSASEKVEAMLCSRVLACPGLRSSAAMTTEACFWRSPAGILSKEVGGAGAGAGAVAEASAAWCPTAWASSLDSVPTLILPVLGKGGVATLGGVMLCCGKALLAAAFEGRAPASPRCAPPPVLSSCSLAKLPLESSTRAPGRVGLLPGVTGTDWLA